VSNLKYLYANGESWTEGVKFDEETGILQDQRWSKLLSDKLGLIEINESEGGGSNDRMVRTTIEWFDNNIDKWDEVLVILGFIDPIRMEYWDEVDNNWCQWNARDMDNIILGNKKWWKKYVTLFLNDVSLHHNLKNQILLLTSFFDSNNIKYLMFFSWGTGMIADSYPYSGFEIYKTINTKYIISETFKEYIENKIGPKKALTKCDHASVEGHKIWTEKLCKELKDRKVT
jgi:hypothetical protein